MLAGFPDRRKFIVIVCLYERIGGYLSSYAWKKEQSENSKFSLEYPEMITRILPADQFAFLPLLHVQQRFLHCFCQGAQGL